MCALGSPQHRQLRKSGQHTLLSLIRTACQHAATSPRVHTTAQQRAQHARAGQSRVSAHGITRAGIFNPGLQPWRVRPVFTSSAAAFQPVHS